ncbi:N-acetyltransferase family protein [Haloparvum sp. PAK95]|uniref:GNAT family N-acetyltransferase n=1 Tax=Haloparvum sp. PAK95 TaxID=3418962 RepID=UPI003D2EDA01
MRLTPATTDDVDAIVDLWVDLASDQRQHGSHVRADPSRGAVRETVGRQVVTGYVTVARDDDAVAGFVMASIDRGGYDQDVTRGVVNAIYVRPEFRDDGVGGELLRAAERTLAEAGADVVALEAMAANEDARRFYRTHGYEPHRVELEKPLDERAKGGTESGTDGADRDESLDST